ARSAAERCGWSRAWLGSRRPAELRRREPGLPFVLDAERVDARTLRLGRGHRRADRMEDADETNRLGRFDAERHDVLDLEVDRIADTHAMDETVVVDLNARALGAEHLADERPERAHRATELAAEHLHELVELLVVGTVVDEEADAPVAFGHHLRRV